MISPSTENQPTKVSLNDLPINQSLSFIRGDQVDRKFLWTGVVYTPLRPKDANGLEMFAVGETPVGTPSPTALVAPWEERFWHSEIRSGYTSTMRYYNGWVPWYGSSPRNWTWWTMHSLKGIFNCTATYSDQYKGTIVDIKLPSVSSAQILPSKSYNWDLESARPVAKDVDDKPTHYDTLKTWIGGLVTVTADWTLSTPLVGAPT